MSTFSLKRHERIKRSADFIRIYQKGAKKESQHFKVAVLANNLQWSRLGVAIGKRIGGSVQRNHAKRLVREYFRLHKLTLPASTDIVCTAKPGAAALNYAQVAAELDRLFNADAAEL